MKDSVTIFSVFLFMLLAIKVQAKDKEQVYRAVYELSEIYTYIGNNWEPDFFDEKSEVKFRKDILRLELYPESSFCYSYHTWFAPEIPVPEGPWKLCGLPGLILEAYDVNRDYVFEGCGLMQSGSRKVGFCMDRKSDDYFDVTRDKFFNNWWQYKHSNFAAKIRAAYGVGPKASVEDNKPKVVNYDKEETDYPHDL